MPLKPAEKGTVQSVLSAEDGSIYSVKLDSSEDAYFIRSEIQKLRENED